VRQLAEQTGHSTTKLYRIIGRCLAQPPASFSDGLPRCRHFIADGTFLHRPQSLLALMDAETNTVVAGQYPISESSQAQLLAFLPAPWWRSMATLTLVPPRQ